MNPRCSPATPRPALPWRIRVLTTLLLFLPILGLRAEGDWRALFDGHSLAGWTVQDARYWSVEDGSIVGRITRETPCTRNQYLVWSGGELADFELKMRVRLRGEGGINNGFQFRSRLLPDGDVCGYQVDNNLQTPWLVRLYDEYGRHTLAMRGERTVFDEQGERATRPLEGAGGDPWFRLEDWHEYHLTCVGPRLTLRIDDRPAAEVLDQDPQRQDLQGILALQLHSGPPTLVEFRDVVLRELSRAKPLPTREPGGDSPAVAALRREALAWWPLDAGGHGARPSLRHRPDWDRFELNTRATGPGARPGARVVLLDGAHFEAGPEPALEGESCTVLLRARPARTGWEGGLIGWQGPDGRPPLRLTARRPSPEAASELRLEVATDQGQASVTLGLTGPQANSWLDLVVRYDGRELALFTNGQLAGSASLGGKIRRTEGGPRIGAETNREGNAEHWFRGAMEVAAVWSKALSNAEIKSLSERMQPNR